METLIIQCDGLCEPRNPGGYGCWGWIALRHDRTPVAQGLGCLGTGSSNNIAEATAVIQALEWVAQEGHTRCQLETDSQLIVSQADGTYAVRSAHLVPLIQAIRRLLTRTQARLRWIPREQNALADALTQQAYQEATGNAVVPRRASLGKAWGTLTDVGRALGWSAVKVGKALKQGGWREADGAPSAAALTRGLACEVQHAGFPMTLWHVERTRQALAGDAG